MNPSTSPAPSGRFATCADAYPFYLPEHQLLADVVLCRDILTGWTRL